MESNQMELSDREDGEIIEDEFEDISDNSITLTSVGKCSSPTEHLPDISLSSVSEVEDVDKFKQQRHHGSKRRKTHRKRKHSHRKSFCLEAGTDDYVELHPNRLRATIHIENQDCLRNSLSTRLKAMANIGDELTKRHEDDQLPNTKDEQTMSSDEDNDLIQLRVEALRTAVINKFQHRKKRKCREISDGDVLDDILCDISVKINDKENSAVDDDKEDITDGFVKNSKEITKSEENVDSDTQNIAPPDEDEDVLRALLLASLSKKISTDTSTKSLPSSNPINEIYKSSNVIPPNIKKPISTNPYKKVSVSRNHLQHSKVKPIIININCDSDTEDETTDLTQKKAFTIENSVDKFLKEQRAKVEAENRQHEEINTNLFNKSAVKLLPKIKQLEYQNLLQKLKDAQLQKQKLKQNNVNGNDMQFNPATIQKQKELSQKLLNTKRLIRNKCSSIKLPSKNQEHLPDLREEVRVLHKVLKEIQTQKSKRLQMQAKYTSLTPIVKKINQASVERKKCDQDIMRLREELNEAEKKLQETHMKISTYVKELVAKKEEIDSKNLKKTSASIPNCISRNLENSMPTQVIENKLEPVADEPNLKLHINCLNESKLIENNIELSNNDKCLINSDTTVDNPRKDVLPKYISPLDNIERVDSDDPFLIMCPYEVNGNCRDPDCVYKHYRN